MPTKREMEMRQGAYIAQMNAQREFVNKHGVRDEETLKRRHLLTRWEEAGKIGVSDVYRKGQTEARDKCVTLIPLNPPGESVQFVETFNETWPSESLVANVGLAIGVLSDFTGVEQQTASQRQASATRQRRDEYKKNSLTPPEFWDSK